MNNQDMNNLGILIVVIGAAVALIASMLKPDSFKQQHERGLKQILDITDRLKIVQGTYGGKNKGASLKSGMVEASLQLAYYGALTRVLYEWNDGSLSGIFELADKNSNLVVMFTTVHMRKLQYTSPHLYVDNISNNSWLKKNLPEKMKNAKLEYFDSFISDRYNLYAPPGYTLDALVIGAPDVLDVIDRNNLGADIEILGNQLYMIFPEIIDLPSKLPEILPAAQAIADAIDDNLSRYIDDRARGTDQTVAPQGLRLIRK